MPAFHARAAIPHALVAALLLVLDGQTAGATPPGLKLAGVNGAVVEAGTPDEARVAGGGREAADRRKRDPLWNGMLIGGAIGTVYGMAIAPRQFCSPPDPECEVIVRPVIGLPAIAGGVAIGALIDFLIRQDDARPASAWRRLRISPIGGSRTRGLQAHMEF